MKIEEYHLSGRASCTASVESEQRRLRQATTWEQRLAFGNVGQMKYEWGDPEVHYPAAAELDG